MRLLRWGALLVLLTTGVVWARGDPVPGPPAKIPGLCPGYHDEKTADGLPGADSRTTDRERVAEVLRTKEAYLRSEYEGVVGLEVGPGYGAVWDRENGGSVVIRKVPDHAIVARLGHRADCPRGSRQFLEVEGVPVLFASRLP